jgi:hypothetical protein
MCKSVDPVFVAATDRLAKHWRTKSQAALGKHSRETCEINPSWPQRPWPDGHNSPGKGDADFISGWQRITARPNRFPLRFRARLTYLDLCRQTSSRIYSSYGSCTPLRSLGKRTKGRSRAEQRLPTISNKVAGQAAQESPSSLRHRTRAAPAPMSSIHNSGHSSVLDELAEPDFDAIEALVERILARFETAHVAI